MAHLSAPTRLDSPLSQAEWALRKPSSTIWLHHVGIETARFDEALTFYVSTLGLRLRTVEAHPAYPTRLRALLVDAEGRDVLELLEAEAQEEPVRRALLGIGFALPLRAWHLLRARLDAEDYPYRQTGTCLFVEDCDGLLLRVEALGESPF